MKPSLPLYLAVLIIAVFSAAFFLDSRQETPQIQASILGGSLDGDLAVDPEAFARARGPIKLSFPRDHGPHPDYLTEWWYFTGNLATDTGRRFGYQLTFFRRALTPPGERAYRQSGWAADQVYLAHFAISDIHSGTFHAFENFSRGAAGLAGARSAPFRVWLEDWEVTTLGEGRYRLRANQDGVAIDLTLTDVKGPILQGERGYSQKGPDPGNASYYYSMTRLDTSGEIRLDQSIYRISGLSWMDHEYSTSVLSKNQVGWDWFSLQLEDGREIMAFHIRQEDGSIDPFSNGISIAADGQTHPLDREDFHILPVATWRSPISGAEYPSGWRMEIPDEEIILEIRPWMDGQELTLSYTYWEGAVEVTGLWAGEPVRGAGYVELTGYAGPFAGDF